MSTTPQTRTILMFTRALQARFDYQCPAVQDAIDRLVLAEGFRGRLGMIEAMTGPHYGPLNFNSSLLSCWKDSDVLLATMHPTQYWIDLAERLKVAA